MKSILILINIIFLLSCSSTVAEETLKQEVESTQRDTLGTIYYMGRENNYDYFKAQWNVGSKKYKIKVPNSIVKEPMEYTGKQLKWKICGPHTLDRWLP